VLDLDLSEPGTPRLVADRTWPGLLVSARQYRDVVRLVTSTGRPALRFVSPHRGLSRAEARARNRALVRSTTIADWLPPVRDRATGRTAPLVDCAAVYHARRAAGTDTLTVTGFRPGSTGTSATAVTADGQVVYSSAERLYVAATHWPATGWTGRVRPGERPTRTDVHAFRLVGPDATYLGSGEVPGVVRDRWSMDEHDGELRVAASRTDRSGLTRDNGVVVLAERDGRLAAVGQLWGLGRREDLRAVRWFGDLAVLVTFRQVDPLHTVDLTDPARPRALGALEVPGFSSYLHPIGADRLLGIGTRATRQGATRGAQAALFDVADPTHPRRLDAVAFGRWTDALASWDPRAFTWLPGADAALTTVHDYRGGGRGALTVRLLRVGADGALSDRTLATAHGWTVRALPLPDGLVALVDRDVRLVDVGG
jgi:hypothetical protein